MLFKLASTLDEPRRSTTENFKELYRDCFGLVVQGVDGLVFDCPSILRQDMRDCGMLRTQSKISRAGSLSRETRQLTGAICVGVMRSDGRNVAATGKRADQDYKARGRTCRMNRTSRSF